MEISAYKTYSGSDFSIFYWRTTSGYEVDFILGQGEAAIEVKSASGISDSDCKGLLRFVGDYAPRRAIVVTNEDTPRTSGRIEYIPWRYFLDDLWEGKIITRV